MRRLSEKSSPHSPSEGLGRGWLWVKRGFGEMGRMGPRGGMGLIVIAQREWQRCCCAKCLRMIVLPCVLWLPFVFYVLLFVRSWGWCLPAGAAMNSRRVAVG